ncbi:unnamed protein product, partial [Tilletia laevis]
AALVLLALVSVRSVQGVPIPESPHSPPVERAAARIYPEGVHLPSPSHTLVPRFKKKKALLIAGAAGAAAIAAPLVVPLAVIAAPFAALGGLGYGGYRLVKHFEHRDSGTSPTNGRRAVVTTTPAAETHRDPVRHEAADSINSAKPIALNVEYHQVVSKEPEKNARALATGAMSPEA